MNEKLSTIVLQFQKLVDALIDEATTSLVDWDLYQSSYTFVKRILATPTDEFGYHSNHLVDILSKRYQPFKRAKIRMEWFSCGGNVRTYKNQLVHNGIEVRSCDNMPQSEITKLLQLFRDSLPSIVSSLIGPEVWRKASFSDLPLVYQSSWDQSIEYAVLLGECHDVGLDLRVVSFHVDGIKPLRRWMSRDEFENFVDRWDARVTELGREPTAGVELL